MAETALPGTQLTAETVVQATPSTLSRVAKYTAVRLSILFFTVLAAVYITIIVANMGGYMDEVVKANIQFSLAGLRGADWFRELPESVEREVYNDMVWQMEEARGLHKPFMLRTVMWLVQGLTLDWGPVSQRVGGAGTSVVYEVILDALPRTLLLFGISNLLLFVSTVSVALWLTRIYGGFADKLITALSPISAIPPWVFGILLTLLFLYTGIGIAGGGTFESWASEFSFGYVLILLRHMAIPILAIFLSKFFQGVYNWRSFFLIYSNEDYVDLAQAKGLPRGLLNRKYLLRPTMPSILTSFVLILVALWQEVIILEQVFNVSGIGRLFISALRGPDVPVIVGLVTTFGYLLALTVFLLDIAYALVDPRVKVEGQKQLSQSAQKKHPRGLRNRRYMPAKASPRSPGADIRSFFARLVTELKHVPVALREMLSGAIRERHRLKHYPFVVAGIMVILVLIGISIYTVIAIPYEDAVAIWRGYDNAGVDIPENARPIWVNLFRKDDLPVSLEVYSTNSEVIKTVEKLSETQTRITLDYTFDYPYSGFPQEIRLYINSVFDEKQPLVSTTWITPDGREFRLTNKLARRNYTYYISYDDDLTRKLGGMVPEKGLFLAPNSTDTAQQGTYHIQVSGIFFEPDVDMEGRFLLLGQVYGLAGTDQNRIDLLVPLLWGTPVALLFGFVAAITTIFLTMLLAAIGTWFGGAVDMIIQRVTDVNLVLPFFPVALMIFTLYSKSVFVILAVVVILNIFNYRLKNYRAIFMQMREMPYLEAAQAYGSSNWRIIFRYLVPRVIVILIPEIVILVPSYVFLEAALAYLGLSDPLLPTWGKLITSALSVGIYGDSLHRVLFPAAALLITAYAFAVVGFGLERTFHPRLKKL